MSIFFALSFISGVLLGPICLGFAVFYFLADLGIQLSLVQQLTLLLATFSLPISAYLLGSWIDSYLGGISRNFSRLAVCFAMSLVFSTDLGFSFLEKVVVLMQAKSAMAVLILFSSIVTNIVFCAALAGISLFLINLSVEIPLRWLEHAAGKRLRFCYPLLRVLLIIIGISAGISLILEFFTSKLGLANLV